MLRLFLATMLVAGCGDDDGTGMDLDAGAGDAGAADGGAPDGGADAGPPDGGPPDAGPACVGPPGLYSDALCTVISSDLRLFSPRYPLWSDAAGKERYIFLPPLAGAGAAGTIDTSDPNHWVFPVGTRLYKTFLRDGLRLETRILEKTMDGIGPDFWTMRVFAWDEGQRSVAEVTDGVPDALGTTHDIPPQAFCARCHQNGQPDVSLGFQAMQLNHAPGEGEGVTLRDLIAEGRLSTPIAPATVEIPTLWMGSATTDRDPAVTRAALGYLHANCGPCHGGASPQRGLVFFVDIGLTYVEETGIWTTAVDVPSSWTMGGAITRIVPGSTAESTVHVRMGLRGDGQMPPIATELVDDAGLAAVDAWIDGLTP